MSIHDRIKEIEKEIEEFKMDGSLNDMRRYPLYAELKGLKEGMTLTAQDIFDDMEQDFISKEWFISDEKMKELKEKYGVRQ